MGEEYQNITAEWFPISVTPTDNGSWSCVVDDTNASNSNWSCYDYAYYDQQIDDATVLFYHILWSIATPILFSLIIVIGTLGNLLVIYVILSRATMQTATNYLLINLAFSDVAFLVICVPITAYRFAAVTWPFGDATCKVVNYIIYVTAYVTVYTLVAVSLLRYVTVVHGVSTARYRTKQNIILCNIFIWVLILLVNIPSLLTHKLKVFNEHFSYCGLVDGSPKPFFVTFFVFGYALPLGIICVLYVIIIAHLRLASASTVGQTRQRTARASKVIALVVIVFALLWLPLQVNQLLSVFKGVPQGKWYEVFRVLATSMAYGNSCANPIIYNFVSREFKRGFYDVMCCCRKRKFNRARNGTLNTENGLTTERTAMV